MVVLTDRDGPLPATPIKGEVKSRGRGSIVCHTRCGTSPFMGDFESSRRENRSSGAILEEKAMRATLEWRGRGPSLSVVVYLERHNA